MIMKMMKLMKSNVETNNIKLEKLEEGQTTENKRSLIQPRTIIVTYQKESLVIAMFAIKHSLDFQI